MAKRQRPKAQKGSPSNKLLHPAHWLRVAKQRLTTAEFLAQYRMYLDSLYLAGYAPECVLKAVILSRIPANRRLVYIQEHFATKQAHDYAYLKELLLRDCALSLPLEVAKLLRRLHWSTDLRYETGSGRARDTEVFLATCRDILAWGERSI